MKNPLRINQHAILSILQTVHKRPVKRIENDESTWKQESCSTIDPVAYLLWRHCRPTGRLAVTIVPVTTAVRQRLRRVTVQR